MARPVHWQRSHACGTCGVPLDFRRQTGLVPGGWSVHRDTHRFRCYGRRWRGPNTQTAPYVPL